MASSRSPFDFALTGFLLSKAGRTAAARFTERLEPLGLRPRHLISTIYPRELAGLALEDVFVTHHPDIYYSIYSMSERFRRRWLPKALPAEAALDRLVSWQRSTHKIVSWNSGSSLYMKFIGDSGSTATTGGPPGVGRDRSVR